MKEYNEAVAWIHGFTSPRPEAQPALVALVAFLYDCELGQVYADVSAYRISTASMDALHADAQGMVDAAAAFPRPMGAKL